MFLAPQSILWSRADTLAEQPLIKLMPVRYAELLAATEGLKRAGVPLVSAYGDSLAPTAAGIDDLGVYWIVPKIALAFDLPPARAWDWFFILTIGVCFAAGFVGMRRLLVSKLAKALCAVVYATLFLTVYFSGDVYAISPAFAALLVPHLLLRFRATETLNAKHRIALFFLGATLVAGHIARAHSTTAVGIAFLTLLFFQKSRFADKLASAGIALAGAAFVGLSFKIVLLERDAFFERRQPNYVAPTSSHPFWSQAYIGFGFLDNDYGIRYKDSVALAKAREVSPNVPRHDAELERVMRDEVLGLFKKYPLFVIRTFAAKAGVIGFYALVFMNAGFFFALRHRLEPQTELALLLGMGFNALPGFVALPNIPYLTGSFAFAAIYGALHVDNAVKNDALTGVLKKIAT